MSNCGIFKNAIITAGFLLGSNLFAAQWIPISYSMDNGDSHGVKSYRDDTYNGLGDPTNDNSFLSGGTGQLTDGLFGNDNFLDAGCGSAQPAYCWVAWVRSDPVITLDLGAARDTSQVNIHGNDWNTDGITFWPTATYSFSNDGVLFGNQVTRNTVAGDHIPTGDGVHNTAHFLNQNVSQTARYIQIALTGTNNLGTENGSFIFVDEIQIFGPDPTTGAVPEPATITLLAGGLLAGVYFRRRNG